MAEHEEMNEQQKSSRTDANGDSTVDAAAAPTVPGHPLQASSEDNDGRLGKDEAIVIPAIEGFDPSSEEENSEEQKEEPVHKSKKRHVPPPAASLLHKPAARSVVSSLPKTPTSPDMKWYVVQAYSGYENKVKQSLEQRVKDESMDAYFGEILIPKENVQDNRAGKKRVAVRTFYPGYIFVQMHLTEDTWHFVKDTPKVSGFVGGRNPAPVPAPEISAIAQQVADGAAKPKPRVVFEAGDHVRVNDGAFANFTGTIEEVKPEKQKVRVLVSIFGRATPVELDYAQVEKTV